MEFAPGEGKHPLRSAARAQSRQHSARAQAPVSLLRGTFPGRCRPGSSSLPCLSGGQGAGRPQPNIKTAAIPHSVTSPCFLLWPLAKGQGGQAPPALHAHTLCRTRCPDGRTKRTEQSPLGRLRVRTSVLQRNAPDTALQGGALLPALWSPSELAPDAWDRSGNLGALHHLTVHTDSPGHWEGAVGGGQQGKNRGLHLFLAFSCGNPGKDDLHLWLQGPPRTSAPALLLQSHGLFPGVPALTHIPGPEHLLPRMLLRPQGF